MTCSETTLEAAKFRWNLQGLQLCPKSEPLFLAFKGNSSAGTGLQYWTAATSATGWSSTRSTAPPATAPTRCPPSWRAEIEAEVNNPAVRDALWFGLCTGMRRDEVLMPRWERADAAPSPTRRPVNHARPDDATQGYAADWAITQLREPARKIADRIEALMCSANDANAASGADCVPRSARLFLHGT